MLQLLDHGAQVLYVLLVVVHQLLEESNLLTFLLFAHLASCCCQNKVTGLGFWPVSEFMIIVENDTVVR